VTSFLALDTNELTEKLVLEVYFDAFEGDVFVDLILGDLVHPSSLARGEELGMEQSDMSLNSWTLWSCELDLKCFLATTPERSYESEIRKSVKRVS
jgi:hypothetical protein